MEATERRSRRLDRKFLLMLGPFWLVCVAVFVLQAVRGGIVWPSILVSGPTEPGGYPVVVGYWPGMDAEATGLRRGDHVVRVSGTDLAGVTPIGLFARLLEARGTGHTVRVGYHRAGVVSETELALSVFPVPWWSFLLLPATFAVLAVVVALRAPPAGEAHAVVLAYVAISFFFLPWPGGPRVQSYAYLLVLLISAIVVLPLSVRSFLLFPEEVAPRSRWIRGAPWAFAVFPVVSRAGGSARPCRTTWATGARR
jgi:hypothetical protein